MTDVASLMQPATGQIVAPGAAERGYTLAPSEVDPGAALAELQHHATVRKNEVGIRAIEALDGSDPFLHPLAVKVRPTFAKIWQDHDAKLAASRADPQRRYLTR